MRASFRSFAALSASVFCMTALPAQNVLQVGPTQPFVDVQTALGFASDGDVVEVEPGTYPPFTIVGKRVAVIAKKGPGLPGTFAVTGAPAITIGALGPGQSVTIANARITATAVDAAIRIDTAGAGSVRLLDTIVTAGNLGVVPHDGLIEARNSPAVWLDRVRAGDYRWRANGAAGFTGLAALFVDQANVHVARSVLQGMRSDNPALHGGDAIRVVGSGRLTSLDSLLTGSMAPLLALPGVLGGHAIHDFGGNSGPIRVCGGSLAVADVASSPFAVLGSPSFLLACLPDTIVRTELPAGTSEWRLGATTTATVSVEVPGTICVLAIGDGFGLSTHPAVAGDLLLDGALAVLAGAVVTTPWNVPLTMPSSPLLVGMQGTLQAIAVGGSSAPLATAGAAAFTVR